MRAAAFISFLALVWGQACDTNTCQVCQTLSGCGWYSSGSFGECVSNTTVPSGLGLSAVATCPSCQAGNCTDCQKQAGCAWYNNTIPQLGGTCGSNTTAPTTTVGSYVLTTTCPPCASYTTCQTCTNNQNLTCGWYVLPGSSGGRCAEASPGFVYSKVGAGFCSGNPCAGVANCQQCQAVNISSNCSGYTGNPNPCAWYTPASGLSAFYNAKCDLNGTGIVLSTLYNTAVTCPICTDTTCVTCQADPGTSGCQWLAVTVLGVTSFGQCVTSGNTVTGKSVVSVCPAVCQVYSCTTCIGISSCRWYTGSSVGLSDSCDLATNTIDHPFQTALGAGATCPPCKDSRCFECNSETGCGWYLTELAGLTIPGTGRCAPTASPPSSSTLLPNSNSKCAGASDAAALVPGLFVLLGSFFV